MLVNVKLSRTIVKSYEKIIDVTDITDTDYIYDEFKEEFGSNDFDDVATESLEIIGKAERSETPIRPSDLVTNPTPTPGM